MEAGSFSQCGSRNSAAHIRAHVKRNCHNPLQNILQSPRAREHVKPIPNTIVLQAVQHKSLRNPSVLQYAMLQMFCPRAFFDIIRKQFDFNVCVQISRSHLTSRYIRVGLACVQGMNNSQNNTLPCGTQISLHSHWFAEKLEI